MGPYPFSLVLLDSGTQPNCGSSAVKLRYKQGREAGAKPNR